MTDQLDLDKYRHDALVANTAQGVRNYLIEMNNNRANMRARWIWELLQNARDASTNGLVSVVECLEDEVIFKHNGREFEYEEITHLIYHGSTKVENEGTIGQYGSGFLTTHLLSPQIDVSGYLVNGQSFDFTLVREIASPSSLSVSMDKAWDEFKTSLAETDSQKNFTTRFRYPIGEDSFDAVKEGVVTLQQCAPLVLVFNDQFQRIDIESLGESVSFEVTSRLQLSTKGLHKVTVSESKNGHQTASEYILAQSEDERTTIAFPLNDTDDGKTCLSIGHTPKLFLGFPLVGTEGFSFPGVINGFEFTPMENRDGVYLGVSASEANTTNQAIIEEASNLHAKIIQFVASSEYKDIHVLANIPPIPERTWINEDWLRNCLSEHLIGRLRQTPAVLCEYYTGVLTPKESILPFAPDTTAVEALWDLLSDVKEFRQKLPRRDEVVGWCDAVKSWADIRGCEPIEFAEVVDGRKLVAHIEVNSKSSSQTYGSLENLQDLLCDDVCAVEWLNLLIGFLLANGFEGEVRSRNLILDQGGLLDKLSNLYRDKGIDDELKEIASNLDLQLREFLRDNRLTALTDEIGKGDKENADVVGEIIDKLKELVGANKLSDEFAKASAEIFKWIVGKEQWNYLNSFPAFSETKRGDDIVRAVILLGQLGQDDADIPLAPIKAWPEDLQPFSDIFPPERILANAFYDGVSDLNEWEKFISRGLVRTTVVANEEKKFDSFLPDEPLPDGEHSTSSFVVVTNIAFLTGGSAGSMERIRNSQSRARLFWRFLIEWLLSNDSEGLDVKKADCVCGETHGYFPAAWIVPLVRNIWVPLGNDRRDKATAQSLANLLHNSDALPIPDNGAVSKLLEAIRISRFDLMRESMSSDDETRDAMDNRLMNIMAVVQNNPDRLDVVPRFLEQLKEDEGLVEYIEERRKQKQTIHQNQKLGSLVEEIVRENLESEGFSVKPTGIGSDFEIKYDFVQKDEKQEIGLKLKRGSQSWLVEVKATRDSDARMTPAQARKAVEEGNRFLLCVVPVEVDAEPTLENVQTNMRFVEDIGNRVSTLCNDLDDFEQQRSDITTNYGDGCQLVVMSGTTRIRVDKSVWEDDGFCLSDLPARLK